MSQTIRLTSPARRAQAHRLIDQAPERATVRITPENRTSLQNSKMWAMLGDVSRAKPQGRVMNPEAWKAVFMDAIGKQATWEPALDGNGVVCTGYRSSRLSVADMSAMIEQIYAYAAEHGVELKD